MSARKTATYALLLWAFVLNTSCALAPKRSPLMESVARESKMTVSELRTRVRALAPRFAGELEAVADEIAAGSTDPSVRLAMTRFKINALPQMQMALFRPDPTAALIDAWALVLQLQGAVDREDIVQALSEDVRAHLRGRFTAMEGELQALWRKVSGRTDVSGARKAIADWAQENPIDETLAMRKSTTALLADVTTRSGLGPLAATAQLLETTQDLAARADMLGAFGPKEVRWQAEYLVRELLADPSLLKSTQPDLSSMLASLNRLTSTVDGIPAIVSGETSTVLKALHQERLETQDFVRGERQALTADLDRMSRSLVDHSFDRASALLDRFFLFTLILVGLLLLGGGLLLLILFRAFERRREPPRRERRATTGPPVEA